MKNDFFLVFVLLKIYVIVLHDFSFHSLCFCSVNFILTLYLLFLKKKKSLLYSAQDLRKCYYNKYIFMYNSFIYLFIFI